MIQLIACIFVLSLLPSCGKQPKKMVFDRNIQVDCLLNDDEYASDCERIHAKDVARRYESAQEASMSTVHKDFQSVQLVSDELVRLYEAKLADIPVPMGSKPIKHYFESATIDAQEFILGYVSDQSMDDLALFYDAQMEQVGWRQTASFFGVEQLLVFENSDRICVISLRTHEGWFYQRGRTEIVIFHTAKAVCPAEACLAIKPG